MILHRRFVPAVVLGIALTGILPTRALAGGPAPAGGGCPARTVCDATLGVALTPSPGWRVFPASKNPPHTLTFATLPITGLSYTVRLVVEPFAVTSIQNDRRAARWVAHKLIQAERVPSSTERSITIGGTDGVLIQGLPGSPGPAVDILLARHGNVYLIIAPGRSLAPDQRRALARLRFIPRVGHFLPQVGG